MNGAEMQMHPTAPASPPDPSNPDQVGAALLAYLQDQSGPPPVNYANAPAALAIGVETWVYSLALRDGPAHLRGPLVLRLFPPETDPACARFEAVVQNTVAELGYPAPRVLLVCEDPAVLGGPFLLMEQVPGRMMMDSLFDGSNPVFQAPHLIHEALTGVPTRLADAQARLHRLDASVLRAALEAADVPTRFYTIEGWLHDMAQRIEAAALNGLRPTFEWLHKRLPREPNRRVICHCDFLPPNLMVDDADAVHVIDWSHTTIADPAWDIANTRLRLRMNPFEAPRMLLPLVALLRPRVTRAYEARYGRHRPIDPPLVQYYEVFLGVWMLIEVAERRLGGSDAASAAGRGANPWLQRGATRPLEKFCRAVTGTAIAIPSESPRNH